MLSETQKNRKLKIINQILSIIKNIKIVLNKIDKILIYFLKLIIKIILFFKNLKIMFLLNLRLKSIMIITLIV